MKRLALVAVGGIAIVLIALVGVVLYTQAYQGNGRTTTTTTTTYQGNGQTATTHTDTFFTSCSITGTGSLSLRVVSDSSGTPVQGEKVNAVLRTGCGGSVSETQVVHVDNFTQGQGDWLTPVLPSQATSSGTFNFTVVYQGATYNFSAPIHPVSVTCVTLRVPSGNVTSPSYFASSSDCTSH